MIPELFLVSLFFHTSRNNCIPGYMAQPFRVYGYHVPPNAYYGYYGHDYPNSWHSEPSDSEHMTPTPGEQPLGNTPQSMFHAERDSVSTPSGVRSVRFGNNGLVSRRSQWPELRNHAIVQVSLPAQAELVINGRAIGKPGSNVRGVLTPELDPGSRYTYDVVIRLNQGGQLISRTRRVRFVRGEQLHVDFTNLDKPVVQRIASR